MNQREITEKTRLLDEKGNVERAGYAKKMLYRYNRENITANKARLKEWDYYYIGNDDCALCLTIADMGYIGALSATVMDFSDLWQVTKSAVFLFPMGKVKLPLTSVTGDVAWKTGKVEMIFENADGKRRLHGRYPKFGKNKEDLVFDVTVTDEPEESMVIATPFSEDKHFYFNQKINCMTADGSFRYGEKEYSLAKDKKTLATLDWGRGVWTYDNTWYWSSLQTILPSGDRFGFNVGYGFGANDQASENMLFFNGKSHKLDEVTFNIPQKDGADDYMSDWTFTSNDGKFEMDFHPIIDRYEPFDLKFFAMIPHQVFGKFSGKATLEDGTVVEIKDVLGFAEKVHNKW